MKQNRKGKKMTKEGNEKRRTPDHLLFSILGLEIKFGAMPMGFLAGKAKQRNKKNAEKQFDIFSSTPEPADRFLSLGL